MTATRRQFMGTGLAAVAAFLGLPQDAQSLLTQERRADQGGEDDHSQGPAQADKLACLDKDRDFDDRKTNQGEEYKECHACPCSVKCLCSALRPTPLIT